PIPAVSVSWMHRTLPRIQYGSLGPAFGTGEQCGCSMDLKADNYRAVASWKFVLVDLAAGLGIDHYSSSQTTIRFYDAVLPTSARTIVINPTNTREVLFADAGLSLAAVKLVAELGFQTGKDQGFATTFRDFDPKAGHVFGGIGFRFGFGASGRTVGDPRSGPRGARWGGRAARSRRRRVVRCARRGGCGAQRTVPVRAPAGGAAVRGAQARHVD